MFSFLPIKSLFNIYTTNYEYTFLSIIDKFCFINVKYGGKAYENLHNYQKVLTKARLGDRILYISFTNFYSSGG